MNRLFVLFLFSLVFISFDIFGQTTDLIISEYIEGSSDNKSIEIYNGTGSIVDLSDYAIQIAFNGNGWTTSISLNGSLSNDNVYVVSDNGAAAAIIAVTDQQTTSSLWNGDDAIGLFKNSVLIDVVGEQGVDPGTGWDVAGTNRATLNHTLVRKSDVCSPNSDWDDSRGTNTSNSEWIVYSQDEFGYLGSHSSDCSLGVYNPTFLDATAISSETIILFWGQNADVDDVMVAYSLDGIFGVPVNGTGYSPSATIDGGGVVIYNGASPSFEHTGLTSNTQYFYRAWSVDGSVVYSSGVSDDATTFSVVSPGLIISEIADPEAPNSSAKFVEIYNAGSSTIDFSAEEWYLSREANAPPDGTGGSWCDVQLTGSIASGSTRVIGNWDFTPPVAFPNAYGFEADQYSGCASGNGDDSYYLYYGGDHIDGTLVDAFGEIGVNGYGTLWEYKDSKATRKKHILSPNSTWTASEWVIIPASADEMTPKWHNDDLTWTGSSSSDWSSTLNWNDGAGIPAYPPDAGCDIVIPNLVNDPVISGRASTNNMEIETNAIVTIDTTSFLVTGSEIENYTGVNGLIVKSKAITEGVPKDGMLLLGSGTTQATIERYLSDDMSHFISAPITNATADNLFQDHDPEVYLYEHHEWDNLYHYLVPTTTDMTEGKGFSTWVDDADLGYIIANFDGNLMSSDLTLNSSTIPALSYTYMAPPNDTLGYNLLGNPYPVPLNWLKGSWVYDNIEETVWIWKPASNLTPGVADGNWVLKTSSGGGSDDEDFNGVIPSGQAFFVRANDANPSITIPADARTVYYPSTTYYKTREDDNDSSTYAADYVTIMAMNEEDEEEIWISFNEFGTEDFDNGWDASKLRNSYSTVCLYIPKETRDQCIEHLPTLYPDEERIVEIGFETTTDGEHSIVIDATYLPDTDITLEDMKYNQVQNMDSDSIYTFVAFADDDPNRFRIHFNKTTTGIDFDDFNQQTDLSVQIYAYGKNVYIKKEDASTSGRVMLYDMYGREVLKKEFEHTHLMKIPVQLSNSYLVAKVISNSKVFTSKVYIK